MKKYTEVSDILMDLILIIAAAIIIKTLFSFYTFALENNAGKEVEKVGGGFGCVVRNYGFRYIIRDSKSGLLEKSSSFDIAFTGKECE